MDEERRAILEAMARLGRGESAAEIAREAGMSAPVVGRLLGEMQIGFNPRPVESQVDDGRGEKVWFLTAAGADLLDQSAEDSN